MVNGLQDWTLPAASTKLPSWTKLLRNSNNRPTCSNTTCSSNSNSMSNLCKRNRTRRLLETTTSNLTISTKSQMEALTMTTSLLRLKWLMHLLKLMLMSGTRSLRTSGTNMIKTIRVTWTRTKWCLLREQLWLKSAIPKKWTLQCAMPSLLKWIMMATARSTRPNSWSSWKASCDQFTALK